jgi:Uma2 family endonuclease
MVAHLVRRRFSVDEFERMIRAGILTADDRVELIEGEIVEMSPIGRKHAACVNRGNRLFSRAAGDAAIVAVQSPVRLDEVSEVQPDLAILKPKADFYSSAVPRPDDVLLIVEVSDTTIEKDRRTKLPLYAKAGIPETWLVDVEQDRIEVCRKPGRKGYGEVRVARRGDRIRLAGFPAVEIAVDQILP